MNITKRCTLLRTFFISQFNYCPLIWMCHSRAINRLHKRCLRIIYNGKVSTFEQLLEKDSSVSMHTRNLSFLAVEMFKVAKGLAPTIIQDLFPLKETNNYKHIIFRTKSLGNAAIRNAGM